jgi:hypothetical protein
MSRLLPLFLVATLAVALSACRDGGDGPGGGFQTLGDGPAGIEDVVQHLADAPDYPAPVTAEPELAELRSPDVNRRHHLYLAAVDQDGTLDGELVRGSVVQVADGSTLTAPEGASVAQLDGTTVTEVSDCPAPCEVTGPALVAPADWLEGIRVAEDWELLVPAPTE